MIAPTFESLSTKYSKPKRITFCKVNVDNQRDVASKYGVSAMPTFLILKNGTVIETIRGANPPALTAAVEKAVKLAGPASGASFGTAGRTLGGTPLGTGNSGPRQSLQRPLRWDMNNFINGIINFFGLYMISLFSVSSRSLTASYLLLAITKMSQFDPYKSAENSKYNIKNPVGPAAAAGSGSSGQRPGAPKSSFRTLADLGGD